jgi:hypothetical protein
MKHCCLTILIAVIFTSCFPQEDRINEVITAPNTYTRDFTITSTDWLSANDPATGPYYYCEFQEFNLTNEILNKGILQGYYCYTIRDNVIRYVPLPYEEYWSSMSEFFTVEFKIGLITFICKNTTSDSNNPPTNTYNFRVRFLW